MMRATYLLFASLLAPLSPLTAQTDPQTDPAAESGRFGEELVVREVLLDALVTDRSGRVIVGLGKDDFVVEENGELMAVTGVSFYSNRELIDVSNAPVATADVPQDRYFVLFFQDRRFAASGGGLAGRHLLLGRDVARWAREDVLPTDWVAVVGYNRRLEVYQDFTSDKKALEEAIQAAAQGRPTDGDWPSRREQPAAGRPSLLAQLPAGKELRKATRSVYKGLQVLARAAGEVPGRKILVFFGLGFGGVSPSGYWEPDRRKLNETLHELNDNNVAAYSVDITRAEVRHTLEPSLSELAYSTGGEYFQNHVSFATPLQKIAEANNGYYLLSYRSTHPSGESGYQKVKVTLQNKELRVRARRGYLY